MTKFEDFLIGKLSHLKEFYKSEEEFITHLKSGEVTLTIPDVINYVDEFNKHIPDTPGAGYTIQQVGDAWDAAIENYLSGLNPNKQTYLSSLRPVQEGDYDFDGMMDWAENNGWVWNRYLWSKDGWKSRNSIELYKEYFKQYLSSLK